ncbi:hypothetical protein [Sulfurovum sp.]|uniref:hypothetical protein n=1 Tax=Sulfurovum sp. TaxID=1969726 RepID=UPI0025E81AB0|nr:hypothetical protein [Sulfurovum sp.]
MSVFRKVLLLGIILLMPTTLFSANEKSDNPLAVIYTVDGNIQDKFNALMEKKIKTIGFHLTDPHKRVNDQYKKKYGSTVLDVLSFMPVVNDKMMLPLLNIDPRTAGFGPFNMLIAKKLDEPYTQVGHLSPKVMLDILGIKNDKVRKTFTESFNPLNAMLEKELGGKKRYLPVKKLPKQTMLTYEYDFQPVDDIEDFMDEIQDKFETAFIDKNYLIAGYHNFMEGTPDAKKILKGYDAFWSYSLCHLEFSYNMFDTKGAHPLAGLFAPCTMYMFIPKGSNKLFVGMYRLHNWSDTLGITDEKRVKLVEKLDTEIPALLKQIGMKPIPNVNPLTLLKKTTPAKTPAAKTAETTPAAVSASKTGKKFLAKMYVIEGKAEKQYNQLVEKEIESIGFNMADPHHRVNDQYKAKYGSTVLDVLSFLPAVDDSVVMPLFNIDPRIAGFSPFNMLIYKKLTDKVTHVGHLTPEAMLDILGIDDETVKSKFTASFAPLDKKIEIFFKAKGLKYTVKQIPYENATKKKMLNFIYTFKRDDDTDMDDFIEEFQNKFELAFIDKHYLIAGFHNFMDNDDAEDIIGGFDAFWSYSLCHLNYSYNVFDTKGARPDAGLFAPCTMYVYIKKDSNQMVIGMPTLANVKNTLHITSKKRVEWIDKLDKEIPEILTSMGMVAVENVNPLKETPKPLAVTVTANKTQTQTQTQTREHVPAAKTKPEAATPVKKGTEAPAPLKKTEAKAAAVQSNQEGETIQIGGETIKITIPKPPKPVQPVKVETYNSQDIADRSIKFSKRIPPNYISPEQRAAKQKAQNTATNIGEVVRGRVSAYIRGKFIEVKEAKKRLKKAGFTILSVTPLDKKGKLVSIVFTDKELTKEASKKNRGFAASLRLLVNKKNHHISITNPIYMAKAFLQDNYNDKAAKAALKKITSNFNNLLNSKDKLKFQLLPKYQFMHGMPQYQDMVVVARGNNLLKKIKHNKKVVFEQKLDNGATLIGVLLGRRTNKFISRIGTNNAALLPYPVLIENGEAKIMEPKYYISVMYPLLQMSEFMTIATVPGAIIRDCGKVFK